MVAKVAEIAQAGWGARRWQTFADAVALALGVNTWVSLVLLPALFGGALGGRLAVAAALAPLALLLAGVARRSDALLLLIFPSSLLVPLALAPATAQVHVYSPWRLALVGSGLIAYLFCASAFTSFREPPPPRAVRPLASAGRPVPERWRRRLRVYRGLLALSIVFPLVLLHAVHFDAGTQAFLREKYAGKVPELVTLLDLGVIALWIALYGSTFLGLLRVHRTGDPGLQRALFALANRPARPGAVLYVGALVALALMALLLLVRR